MICTNCNNEISRRPSEFEGKEVCFSCKYKLDQQKKEQLRKRELNNILKYGNPEETEVTVCYYAKVHVFTKKKMKVDFTNRDEHGRLYINKESRIMRDELSRLLPEGSEIDDCYVEEAITNNGVALETTYDDWSKYE